MQGQNKFFTDITEFWDKLYFPRSCQDFRTCGNPAKTIPHVMMQNPMAHAGKYTRTNIP